MEPLHDVSIPFYDSETTVPYYQVAENWYLGQGVSGQVVKVKERATNRFFARKMIAFRGSTRYLQKRRLLKEIGVVKKLSVHDHFVYFQAVYETGRYFGLILGPVANSGDLSRYLEDYNNIEANSPGIHSRTSQLERAFGCLASGLTFMQSQGVHHKDIRPKNILVHGESIIFTDFGSSYDSSGATNSISTGTATGMTYKYAAPEVLQNQSRDSKSDVWSLGCVFFEMFSAVTRSCRTEISGVVDAGSECRFAGMMEGLHGALRGAAVYPMHEHLRGIVLAMTAAVASQRPAASAIATQLLSHDGFSCRRCQPQPVPTIQESSGAIVDQNPEWSEEHQHWLRKRLDPGTQRHYRQQYDGNNWVFFQWCP